MPPPLAAWGGEERSERAGWGRRTRLSCWRRLEAEGEEPRRREGAGSGARAGATIAPRAGLSVAAVASAVGGAWRGGAGGGLCVGRRAAVLSPPLPVERLGQPGRPRLPPDARPTAAAAAASPRPCREGRRRGGLPGRRGEQVRARGPPRLVRGSAEGAARKARRPECHRLPPRPRPAPVLLAPGFAEGFPEAVAVTPAGSWGRRLSAPGQRSGSGTWRKGKAGGAPARGERGAPGRAARRGYGPRRGGWAARSWSRSVYTAARVTSAEKRTELTRLIPRGGQGGGPAPEEARPGRVGEGGRLRPAPGQGGEPGAGPGRLRPRGVAWRTGDQFPSPSGLIAASYLSCPPVLAGTAGCTRSFFYSRSARRPPAATSPYPPGSGEAGL